VEIRISGALSKSKTKTSRNKGLFSAAKQQFWPNMTKIVVSENAEKSDVSLTDCLPVVI